MKAIERSRCQAPLCKRYKQAASNDQSVYGREKCTSLVDLSCSWSHVNKSCYLEQTTGKCIDDQQTDPQDSKTKVLIVDSKLLRFDLTLSMDTVRMLDGVHITNLDKDFFSTHFGYVYSNQNQL